LGLVAGAAALTIGGWIYADLHRPHDGLRGATAEVVLEPGLDAGSMLNVLADAGVIRNPRFARAWLYWNGGAEHLHAGEYSFDGPIAAVDVLERLLDGDVELHEVTLPEGLNLDETARRLEAAGFGSYAELKLAFDDPAPIQDLDADAPDLEGYLFPETYRFPAGERPSRIAEALVAQFRSVMGDDLTERSAAVGLSVREAVTLASMIERETSVGAERARISGVFHNRLGRGMRLECDPTVVYALHRAGRSVERLTYADLRFESPWNTYVIGGLPTGPIANPGRESMVASLAPEESDDLYFVAAPGGGHRFSPDLPSHRKAVLEWRRYVRSSP
jgi:UPF0755 protein